MIGPKIKKGQIWINRFNGAQVLIAGKSGVKWKAKVLTDRAGVFNGSHTFNQRVLWDKFELLP